MQLTRLKLNGWRNYESLDLHFEKGLNVFIGPNGSGKTNILESIFYLLLARSFRTNDDDVLIADGHDSAYIHAYLEGSSKKEIEIEITKTSKVISINGKRVRKVSELFKALDVILFSPNDVPLFMGSPGERRNFMDMAISKRSDDYYNLIVKASKILKERNALLKESNPDKALLGVLTEQLEKVSLPIISYRRMFVTSLNDTLPSVLSALRREKTECAVVYRPFVKDDATLPSRIKKAYEDSLDSDLTHRQTNVGVHREDISFILNGKDLASYGSQGENRLAVLSLKLCPYFMSNEEDEKPIIALDDVTSELDDNHIAALINLLGGVDQAFITATTIDIKGSSIIDVTQDKAIRRI